MADPTLPRNAMKEQGRQYQVTVYLKVGVATRNFNSKKKAEAWAKEQKGMVSYHVDVVR